MNFGEALQALLEGKKLERTGWNGKGMFIYYVPANSYPSITDAAKSHFGGQVPYREYLAMKTINDEVVPWVASQSCILAKDWQIVE
jgi:hypothetical protein